MTNHKSSFKVCQWLLTVYLLFSSLADSKVCNCTVFLSLSEKLTWCFTKIDNPKRELAKERERKRGRKGGRTAKKQSENVGSEIWIKHKWSYSINSCMWECGHWCCLKDFRYQAKTTWQGRMYQHKGKKQLLQKGWKCPKGSGTGTLKILSEMVSDIESTKDKILEADLNLDRSITTCQSIEKILTQYHELFYEKRAHSTYSEYYCFFGTGW